MQEKREWHLEKSVSVGHLVTTAAAIIGIVLAWAEMDSRIEQNAIENEHQKGAIERIEQKQEKQTDEIKQEIQILRAEQRDDNQQIHRKLDRLIERQNGPQR